MKPSFLPQAMRWTLDSLGMDSVCSPFLQGMTSTQQYSAKMVSSHKGFHPQMDQKANQSLSGPSRKSDIMKCTVCLVHIYPPLSLCSK